MGTRLLVIRSIATVLIIVASFLVGWYIFSRLSQLYAPVEYKAVEDVNNPRLNRTVIEKLLTNLENRELYQRGQSGNVQVSEEDPFYN